MRADRDANPATPEGSLAGGSGLHLPFGITVCGIEELGELFAAGISHVLSILDPGWPVPEAFGSFGEHRKLELRFHDVIEDGIAGMRPPGADDVARILAFGRDLVGESDGMGHLLVHCHAGVSRSTASMGLIIAQARPDATAPAVLWKAAVPGWCVNQKNSRQTPGRFRQTRRSATTPRALTIIEGPQRAGH